MFIFDVLIALPSGISGIRSQVRKAGGAEEFKACQKCFMSRLWLEIRRTAGHRDSGLWRLGTAGRKSRRRPQSIER